MNHTGDTTRLVYVDSKNRDVTVYPNGNSYTLHLTTPIKNVSKVDLVSARVPNTMYNLTTSSNVLSTGTANVSLNQGFYSAYSLATAVTVTGVTMDYLPNEGHMIFSSTVAFTLTISSPEFAKMVGLAVSTPYAASLSLEPSYSGKYTVRSTTMVDFSLNEYVFLDIDELKTPWNIDAKSIDSAKGTFLGTNAQRMFAPIVMDVSSGCIKNFHESKDYSIRATYPEPIGTLQRLTINWYDKDGKPLDFRGWNTNAFVLRLYVTDLEERNRPPVQPLQDVEIRRIVEAMTFKAPEPEKPERTFRISWVLIVFILFASIMAWKNWPTPASPHTSGSKAP